MAQERVPRAAGSVLLRRGFQSRVRQGHRGGALQGRALRGGQPLGLERGGHGGAGVWVSNILM